MLLYPCFHLTFSKNEYNNTIFYNEEFLRAGFMSAMFWKCIKTLCWGFQSLLSWKWDVLDKFWPQTRVQGKNSIEITMLLPSRRKQVNNCRPVLGIREFSVYSYIIKTFRMIVYDQPEYFAVYLEIIWNTLHAAEIFFFTLEKSGFFKWLS